MVRKTWLRIWKATLILTGVILVLAGLTNLVSVPWHSWELVGQGILDIYVAKIAMETAGRVKV